jgi:single-strand DNA-binding protein
VNISPATDEPFLDKEGKQQERPSWHRIVAIGKLALVCHEYLTKGRQVFVEGLLRYAELENNLDGRKQHRTKIVAGRVQFLGPSVQKLDTSEMDGPSLSSDADIPF